MASYMGSATREMAFFGVIRRVPDEGGIVDDTTQFLLNPARMAGIWSDWAV